MPIIFLQPKVLSRKMLATASSTNLRSGASSGLEDLEGFAGALPQPALRIWTAETRSRFLVNY